MKRHWRLDPDVLFLNHGSFGACPSRVLDFQHQIQLRMERDPVHFFNRLAPALLEEARCALARFLGARADDLAFVPNATTGINSVLRSIPLQSGDDLVVTDHEYNACRNVLDYVAGERGCKVVVAKLPYPIESADQARDAILEVISPATRLLLIDHVTSSTGLVLPVEALSRELSPRGILVLVDGAHAPGMLPLDIESSGAHFYTGNCHKWLCAPKGSAFLWVREDLQDRVRPAILSHGANAPVGERTRFRNEFDWTGTRDLSPFLSVPEALRCMRELIPGGWPEIMDRNRKLALEARELLLAALGGSPPCPESMVGALVSVPITGGARSPVPTSPLLTPDPLQEALFRRHAIEAVVARGPGATGRVLRVSAQLYNSREEFETLARALLEEWEAENDAISSQASSGPD